MARRYPLSGRVLLLALSLLLVTFSRAAALERLDCSGISIYYPEGEEKIGLKLRQKTPEILSFLNEQGLKVTVPLHVILDAELDRPQPLVRMIPHREIRIPLRAPGVLEDGYLEKDPWLYFYFKGLCIQGIYAMRSGLPSVAHRIFGEVVSPNIILPPWLTEGVSKVLYARYSGSPVDDPFSRALFSTAIPKDISDVSNHPDKWPGYYSYRIYGVPFVSWLDSRFGWEKIMDFLSRHGSGVIPIEIDTKAQKAFGKTWPKLWGDYIGEISSAGSAAPGKVIEGYWPDPFVFWNSSGIYPGRMGFRERGRYGFADTGGVLWLSEYFNETALHVTGHWKGIVLNPSRGHVWDPGPGGIAVSRRGSSPCLVYLHVEDKPPLSRVKTGETIPAPPGALQLSGPVADGRGRIAVSVNTGGNWDIWIYDTGWKRVTASPGIELDPWWNGEDLVFASDISGTFQIHAADMSQVTAAELGAMLPRNDSYLCLKNSGWLVERFREEMPYPGLPGNEPPHGMLQEKETPSDLPSPPVSSGNGCGEVIAPQHTAGDLLGGELPSRPGPQPYSPWPSIVPDFVAPDLYLGPSDVQAGLVTWGRDVSNDYSVRAGFRYSFDLDYLSFQASTGIKDIGLGYTRYPLSYDPENSPKTEESRNEASVSYRPSDLAGLSIYLNRLTYEPLESGGSTESELWGGITAGKPFPSITPSLTAEFFSGGRTSLFGTVRFVYGSDIIVASHIQAGKTWGETEPGHGTFRVGGDTGEGYFTRRASRLFPIRGFAPNILEAEQAFAASVEVYYPLADLQMGHKTLPLFLHNLSLGTFIDAGLCSEKITGDQLLAGAGFELITSMEIAWGTFSAFKMGVAWPVDQPDYLDEEGPILVLQIGRPL